MLKHIFFITAVVLTATVFADDIAAIKSYPAAKEKQTVVFNTGFDTQESAAAKMPKGYAVKKGEGLNGTSALFYERTDPNEYVLYSFPIKNLVAGQHYIVKANIKTEGIKRHDGGGNFSAICVEYSENGKWKGGFYGSYSDKETDWREITLSFVAHPNTTNSLTFYLGRGNTGKIWFDDITISTDSLEPAILLTRPDRLSFFGNNGKFMLHAENTIPKNAAVIAEIKNGGKTKEILLQQNGLNFTGDAGTLSPGSVEITATLADTEKRAIVTKMKYNLIAYPEMPPPSNACIIDEYNRAIVNGKPFMLLGVYGFATEKNYQRLQEAGFNCLQLYGSLGLKGNTDHKDDIKNVLDGMDLIDKYGLKLLFSLKDQFPIHNGRTKWGGLQGSGEAGMNAVSELAVNTIKNHPALLAYYVSDEDVRKDVPKVLALRELISRNDPWHPTWTLTYRYNDLPYYGISGDTIGVDPYPISEVPNQEKNIKIVKTAMLAGNSTGLPVWVVPQIFNWGVYKLKNEPEKFAQSHFPTLEELRAMQLYAAMLGAKGFVFYSNFDVCQRYEQILPKSGVSEREWAKVVESIKPLKKLEPFIMSTKKPLPIAVESEPKDAVEAGALLDDNGDYRIIIIGTGGKAKGTFTLPEELRKLKGEVKSQLGKTKSLGSGKYEFTCDAVDSDVLE